MSETSKVPDSWTVTNVDCVGSVRTGLQRSPDRQTGRYATKYLRSANITPKGLDLTDVREMDFTPEERDVFNLLQGDILITEASGSSEQVGRAAIWTGDIEGCCFQNHLIRFRPHAVTPEFALIVFRHYAVSGVFARTARGVGIQHLGASRFASLPFPVPPLPEQKRIAEAAESKLEQIREATERLESALRNLAEQVREVVAAATSGTLTESMGEPDSGWVGSIERHMPDRIEEGLGARHVQSLRFDPIPRRWIWSTVAEVGMAQLGRQRSPKYHHGPNMRPYLRVANVFEDRIDTTNVLTMNFERDDAAKYGLQYGDILLNEGQSPALVGRAAIYRDEIPGACFQNTLIRFRAGREVVPEFALLVFRRYMHSGIFKSVARWSTNIAHLGLRRFRALPFPVPPIEEQEHIAVAARSRLDVTTRQTSAVQESLMKMPDMERELLAAAVAGEIVAQVPSDEPARSLLARLGPPPSQSKPRHKTGGKTEVSNQRRSKGRSGEIVEDLTTVLKESGGSLSLPELYARANFDRDQTEHVERFYLALRSDLGRLMRLADAKRENPTVEISDAD